MKANFHRFLIALISINLCHMCLADDGGANEKFEQAKLLYGERTDVTKVETALQLLNAALSEAETPLLKYEILVLSTQALYWKGMHTSGNSNKVPIFTSALEKGKLAKEVDDTRAEAYYWYAASLGRWGEANGILASLARKQELIDHAEGVFERVLASGQPGDSYEGFGADRILGRVYFKLPPFAGGSLTKALKYLDRSHRESPDYALNVIYYAEAVDSNGERNRAKDMLDVLLKKDPKVIYLTRIPETLEEFEQARTLRAELGG